MPLRLGALDRRVISGTTDTPTVLDNERLLVCTGSASVTITAADLGGWRSYSIVQAGTGQVTVAAGSGVTLASDKSSASYKTARQWAVIQVLCSGSGTVVVLGNTA